MLKTGRVPAGRGAERGLGGSASINGVFQWEEPRAAGTGSSTAARRSQSIGLQPIPQERGLDRGRSSWLGENNGALCGRLISVARIHFQMDSSRGSKLWRGGGMVENKTAES